MSAKAGFIEPMLLLRTEKLPEGPDWLYELKFDGYRALAIKTAGAVRLRSRNDKDFNAGYPAIVKALAPMPGDMVIDGEVVALDPEGRPSFNLLQNYGSARAPLHFFIFDVLILNGEDVMNQPLVKRASCSKSISSRSWKSRFAIRRPCKADSTISPIQ